jgi:uncharacterized protein
MSAVELTLAPIVVLGHAALWVGRYNRAHAIDLPKWVVRVASAGCHVALVAILALLAWWQWQGGLARSADGLAAAAVWLAAGYSVFCIGMAVHVTAAWLARRFAAPCPALLAEDVHVVDIAAPLGTRPAGDLRTRLLARLPGNQAFQLAVARKTLRVARLPPSLDGLSIVHLSDLHCCGNLARPFFDELVDEANRLAGDLCIVSGDLFDHVRRLDWIEQVLARLRGRLGTYFILGNHDLYLKRVAEIRRRLAAVGWIDLGGRWTVLEGLPAAVLLAGNELPWLPPAADMAGAPPREQVPLRILVAHSPDQIDWARRWDFDLVLAGHTHGGQIRLPAIGPVLAPSRLGVSRAGGVYYDEPCVVHVSRGISGELALRINCRPELARLELRCGGAPRSAGTR